MGKARATIAQLTSPVRIASLNLDLSFMYFYLVNTQLHDTENSESRGFLNFSLHN